MASVFNRLMIGRPSELEAFINAKASRTNDDTVRASLEDTTQYPILYYPLTFIPDKPLTLSSPMFFNMANLQRVIISVLLILTATFLFMAQTTEAVKGPKITHKVH
jgi:hypothetical protein